MMALRLILLVLNFMVICFTTSFVNATETYFKNPCHREANLVCLQDNFDKLYLENYLLWSEILGNAEIKALACDSVEDTAAFLRLVKLIKGNAEFDEFFSETIEKLCIEKTKCFLDGLLRTDVPIRALLIDKLRTPLFIDSFKIDQVFREVKTNKKYRELSDIYFSNTDRVKP